MVIANIQNIWGKFEIVSNILVNKYYLLFYDMEKKKKQVSMQKLKMFKNR